jgi:repressor LexA
MPSRKSPKKRRSPTRRNSNLTPKQLRLLTFLRDYRREMGYSPTLQELADEFNVSKVTVFEHVETLQEKGFLERVKNKARSLRIKEHVAFPDERPTLLPLAGVIAAGSPIEAIEDRESLDLENIFASSGETFALRVSGDSMIEDQICDGDYVVVSKRQTARNGETVVALLEDGTATLKRFYKEAKGIRLQPANENYDPIITKNVTIQGIVVGVIRTY